MEKNEYQTKVQEMRLALRITVSAVIIVSIIFIMLAISSLLLPAIAYYSMYGVLLAAIFLGLYAGRLLKEVNKKIKEEETTGGENE